MVITLLIIVNYVVICNCYGFVPFFLAQERTAEHTEMSKISSIHKSNICSNFYDFACGAWINETIVPKHQSVWNNWEIVSHKINKRLEGILTSEELFPSYLTKAKDMYKACIKNNQEESKYINELKILIKSLNGWPIVTQRWNEKNYQWEVSVAKIIRTLGVYPLLKIHVFVDLQNTSQHALYIEQGELNLPQSILSPRPKYKHIIEEYEKWIQNTIRYLYPNTRLEYETEIKELIEFEFTLAKLSLLKNKFERIHIHDLSEEFSLRWDKVFQILFHNTTIDVNFNRKIILRNRLYLEKLIALISKTKKKTLANYIIWSVIKTFSRDITDYMRKLNFKMDQVVFSVKEDFLRSHECVNKVITYTDMRVIKKYTDLYIDPTTIKLVGVMIKNIKNQFIKALKENTWLDLKTKTLAIDKISAVKYIIASPNSNNPELEKIFDKIQISSDNHFVNIIQLRAFKSKFNIENLNRRVKFKWTDSLFEVNAYYNVLQNTIFIPVGMLEPPFFNLSAPMAYNYGALGSLIGHEISHALDTSGRHADKNGNIINWWSQKAADDYEERINCFHHQYTNFNASGELTMGENIADNVGLQLSFNALWTTEKLSLKKFRNIKKYINQLFFISFAQIWCETANEYSIEGGEHAPVKTRVLATLANTVEFYTTFQCSKRIDKSCSLW